jgi:RNA polymerase sigma-70 factor, ECF subfamily
MTGSRPPVADGAELCDGDLVRLARDGDQAAFRLLVERHQPMVRARIRSMCANPSDVDDIMQESFLQAFIALDRLRDPDRFAGWVAGIAANLCRGLRRRDQLTLLPDWPEPLHPAATDGLPSAEDLDRADALRAAMAGLPAGQRRAVALHYYADMPAGQIGAAAGAARVSLHKARRRLRGYLAEHRPDLVPVASRRPPMTTVRIACAKRQPFRFRPTHRLVHAVVLADNPGDRELPVWLPRSDGFRIERLLGQGRQEADAPLAGTEDELIGRLLRATGTTVTGVDIDELGPGVTAARIGLTGPARARQVTARLTDGLALAITTGAPIRVADAVMNRLAVPAGASARGEAGAAPSERRAESARLAHMLRSSRPRYEPRNLDFADGLDGWLFDGTFAEHPSESHWHDYTCAAERGTVVISSDVPQPAGFAFLRQRVFADDYRGSVAVFGGEFRVQADGAERAGLFLRVRERPAQAVRGPLTEQAALADPDNIITTVPDAREWTRHEVAALIPGDGDFIVFGMFLIGRGRIELRDPELIRRA